jgi:hypothetical protein
MADARTQRALEVMDSIRAILFEDWDPIGVNGNQNLRNEYDSYIAPMYRLLSEGASGAEITDYLFKLEHDLGMPAKSKDHLPPIVRKLQVLNVKLGSDAA